MKYSKEPTKRYCRLEQKLREVRAAKKGRESEEEDRLLEEMDEAWENMSAEEQKSIQVRISRLAAMLDSSKIGDPMKYNGFTYPGILRWVWFSWFCKRGVHLWDEVFSLHLHEEGDNYLHCDACGHRIFFHAVKQGKKPIGIDFPWYSILWGDVRRLYYLIRDKDEPDSLW